MQLRKVCNHPNLFEPRPTVSPYIIGKNFDILGYILSIKVTRFKGNFEMDEGRSDKNWAHFYKIQWFKNLGY
jgi:hypothetical protein